MVRGTITATSIWLWTIKQFRSKIKQSKQTSTLKSRLLLLHQINIWNQSKISHKIKKKILPTLPSCQHVTIKNQGYTFLSKTNLSRVTISIAYLSISSILMSMKLTATSFKAPTLICSSTSNSHSLMGSSLYIVIQLLDCCKMKVLF